MKCWPANVVVIEIGLPGDAKALPRQTGVAGDTLQGAITYAFTPVMPIKYESPSAAVSRYTASAPFITNPPHEDEIVELRPMVVPGSEPPVAATTPGSAQVRAARRASIASIGPSEISAAGASIAGLAMHRWSALHTRPDGHLPSLQRNCPPP